MTTVNVMGEHVSDHTLTGLDSQLSYRVGVAAFNSEGSSSTEFENVPRKFVWSYENGIAYSLVVGHTSDPSPTSTGTPSCTDTANTSTP